MHKISSDEFLENFQKVSLYYQEILSYIIGNKHLNLTIPLKYSATEQCQEAMSKVFKQFLEHPESFTNLNLEYVNNLQNLIQKSVAKFIGNTEASNNTKKDPEVDKRFKEPEWTQSIYFDFVKEYYLMTSGWIQKSVQQYDLDEDTKRYMTFSSKQFIDALSPANFIFSNPVVIKESIESGMENIVKGMENFLRDIKKSDSIFNISTTNRSYFKVGQDIAATKGKVIFQNDLMQLICYQPKETTYATPLLIIPPWINKYYILDLSENNSFVKWVVNNNFQVFLISWINPKKKHAHKDFEDYLKEGVLDAINEIQKLGYKTINTLGYCIGGTLLATALSYMKSKGDSTINSATFLTTLIDFSYPGEIGTFINKSTIKVIEDEVNDKGYLDGKYLSNSFSLIRANDLVWSFFVNNYLLGKPPAAFDILYWNSDSTNLPAKMYIYYLKNMYIENKLKDPNKLEMLGTKINISQIDVDSFCLAAKGDHIALWDGVYNGYKLLSGNKTFCLTDAGHVAGVVNPINNKKYSHAISNNIELDTKKWLSSAEVHEGSWWISWKDWMEKRSGKQIKSLNYEKLKFLEEAPGSYIRNKS